MKQLSSFMALSVNGGDRISYTYDELDDETGEVISANNKASFYVVDNTLRTSINAVRDWLRDHKLAD
jgi:hypothetical protein